MFIKKKKLENDVSIYTVNNNFINYDLIIKFKNYGSLLDIHYDIYGFQHLLEHTIFSYKNLNLCFNGYTSNNAMCLALNFDDYHKKDFDKDVVLKSLKKWLFKSGSYDYIDLSTNLKMDRLNNYIKELENEYIYRNNLSISWPINYFLLSGGEAINFCGNELSFDDKKKSILKQLKTPVKIPPEDVIIFIKESKKKYLNDLIPMFDKLQKIERENINIKLNINDYYNKIIQFNYTPTNHLVFVIEKYKILDYDLFYILKTLFPFFYYDINEYLDYYIVYFIFNNFYNLTYFLNALEYDYFLILNSLQNNYPIIFIDEFILDLLSDKILNLINNKNILEMTLKEIYNLYHKDVIYFFNLLKDLIKNKKYMINKTKEVTYNKVTSLNEKYLITNISFDDNIFFNIHLNDKFGSIFLNKEARNNNTYIRFEQKNNSIKIKKNFNKDLICMNHKYNSYKNEYEINDLSPDIYFQSLMNLFLIPSTFNLHQAIKYTLNKDDKSNQTKNINIKLSNQTKQIKSEFNFIFLAFKTSLKDIRNLAFNKNNIQEILKSKGLIYYLSIGGALYNKYGVIFFFTEAKPEDFNTIKNIFNSQILTNGIKKFDYFVIESKKSKFINYSEVNKLNKNFSIF